MIALYYKIVNAKGCSEALSAYEWRLCEDTYLLRIAYCIEIQIGLQTPQQHPPSLSGDPKP